MQSFQIQNVWVRFCALKHFERAAPTQLLDYWSTKRFSQTQCTHSAETQGDIKRRNVRFCIWRTCLLLKYHLRRRVGHRVLGTNVIPAWGCCSMDTSGFGRAGWILPPIDWRTERERLRLPWDFRQNSFVSFSSSAWEQPPSSQKRYRCPEETEFARWN